MKTKKKRIIISTIVIIILLAAGAVFSFIYPMLAMKPAETGQIPDTGIYAVRNQINSLYFIKGEDGYILIDSGTKADAVEASMKELSIAASDVKYVLLTHSDYDHVGALGLFADAPIYISEDEVQMLDGTTERNPKSYNKLPVQVELSNIITLTDGQEIQLDEYTVTCIKTPGHTPGSMSYLVGDQYLFTGDAVRIKDHKMMIHPYTMDQPAAANSLLIIEENRGKSQLVLTAHYGAWRADEIGRD